MSSTLSTGTTKTVVFAREWAPRMLSVLRIVGALLFLEHGMQKLFGFPTAATQPGVFSLIWFAAIIELIGGILLLIGLFSRLWRS